MIIQSGILTLLVISLIVFSSLKNDPYLAEWWTLNIGRGYTAFFGTINEKIPFSITEVIITLLVIASITLLCQFFIRLKKKRFLRSITKIATIGIIWCSVLSIYSLSVEFAYNRYPVQIEIYEDKVQEQYFYEISNYFIEDFAYCSEQLEYNENGDIVMPYDRSKLNIRLQEEYKKLDSPYYSSYTATIKPMFYSWIYSMFGISGWYFGPLGEGVVNVDASNAETPFCYAHEMAHGKGVMREDDAQMVAAYICLNSEDPYLRYSGYLYTYGAALAMATYSDVKGAYNEIVAKVNNNIRGNLSYISARWKELGLMNKIGDWINNLYLQMSGDKDGTGSYEDTKPEFDDTGKVIALSRYQKLLVQIFVERFHSVN